MTVPAGVRAAFFTVADERYFLGAAALVASLRRTGNADPVVVLDVGLRPDQRAALAADCVVVPLPVEQRSAANATYYKLIGPALAADQVGADVVALIDSDMIVTASLAPLLRSAAAGRVAGFPDPESTRWFAEWEGIFDLPAPPRRQTYVNAGFVAFSRTHHPDLIETWASACRAIATHPTIAEGAVGPTAQADQDALNALLMSRFAPGTVDLRPAAEAPQANDLAAGVDVDGLPSLGCRYQGTPTMLLHSAGHPKPWRSWRGMRRTAYSVLLVGILRDLVPVAGADVLRLPWWLRPGRAGDAARAGLHVAVAGRNRVRAELRRRGLVGG